MKTLYKISVSTGKMQIWYGETTGDKVVVHYGQQGSDKIQNKTYTAEAKNIGKVNATTPEQQAIVELKALYADQIDNKHYRETEEEAQQVVRDNKQPRKISNYKDRYDKMSPTLLTSVKKNGSRACVINGQMYSKVGRPEEIKVHHLKAAVEALGDKATFDAEVYAEGLSLQRIRSAWLKPVKTDREIIKIAKDRVKKFEDLKTINNKWDAMSYLGYDPNEDALQLKFYIFDIPDSTGLSFKSRVEVMESLTYVVSEFPGSFEFLFPIYTYSHEERMELLGKVVDGGSEGLVHYEPDGVYEFGKRSLNTCKSKLRYDSEALVIGVERCKNGEGKLLLESCDTLSNVKFKAMMKGTHASRMYDVQEQFIGQWVTFKYEELSDTGKPTKPVVEETRLCDPEGNPLD